MYLSKHAVTRMQQRAIDEEIVDLLLAHGSHFYSGGAEIYMLARRTREYMASRNFVPVNMLEKLRDAYIVVANDGTIITAGHRHKRFRRDIPGFRQQESA